jgi:hypothetical protein
MKNTDDFILFILEMELQLFLFTKPIIGEKALIKGFNLYSTLEVEVNVF